MSTEKLKSDEENTKPEENSQEPGEQETDENESVDSEAEESEADIEVEDIQESYTSLKSEYENKVKEVEELTARLRSVSAAYSRQGDEIKATKSRLERQMQYTESKNRGEVVSKLFEPFDNLKRCLEGFQKADIDDGYIQSLEMVKSAFVTAFQQLGLEEIPGKGSLFNPNIHEALMNIPVPDPALNGIVIDVHSTGYRINEIIIKPAKVIVGQCDAPAENTDDSQEQNSEGEIVETNEVESNDEQNDNESDE